MKLPATLEEAQALPELEAGSWSRVPEDAHIELFLDPDNTLCRVVLYGHTPYKLLLEERKEPRRV